MDIWKRLFLSISFLQLALHLCYGSVVYMVGDKNGWTTIGNFDYKTWAATKNFHLGDVITFVYNSQFHNVMRVTHSQYRSCNVTKPIAAYATGNDSIKMTSYGHHYFLCGVPGHCQSGQKVDINVRKTFDIAPPPPPPSAAPVPTLSTSDALKLSSSCNVVALIGGGVPFLNSWFL